MTNLLPNEIYKEVICPTEIQFDMPIEHKVNIKKISQKLILLIFVFTSQLDNKCYVFLSF